MAELLAPAQNFECAKAAINCGADAVYIGANRFGARKGAPNSLDEIKKVVDYAHKFYARVHVTINTILTDSELRKAKDLIWDLYNFGVDAIIFQDFGILELAKNNELPPIALHASTQCNNRTVEKVEFFKNCGVERVILARELSLNQIEKIREISDVEIETFIHGALCVSYSGQCYLSFANGGRSANRGECAQPCRKKYTLIDEDGKTIAKDKYLLCLKDFNASEHIEKLENIGVNSFKIEGRLKDENYVKNVVGHYYKLIKKHSSSGFVTFDKTPDVGKVFNRGFTDYFLSERNRCFNFDTPKAKGEFVGKIQSVGKDFFTIKNAFKAQDGLYFEGGGCLVNKVDGDKVYPNKMDGIKAGIKLFRNKTDSTLNATRKIKCNITFENGKITATDEDKNSVSENFEVKEFAQNLDKMKENITNQLKKSGESDFFVENVSILENKSQDLPFLRISELNELRRNILDKLLAERLKNYKRPTQGKIQPSQFPEKSMDYRANIHNELAKKFYNNCGCKITENSLESGTTTKNKEIMRCKHCLKYAFDMCKSPKNLFLIDDKGKKFALNFDCKNCEMAIKNF